MTNTELKTNIDTAITNKTSVSSITPTNVGEQIKSTVDYIDQEISNIELIPGPQGVQGVQGPQGPIGLTGTQGPAGPQGIVGPVGPAGLEWRGAWVSGTSYIVDDAVGFNGASWFCVNATSGTTSPNLDPTNWALLAAQGSQGSQGPQGPQGIQGTPGNGGVINTYEDVYSSTNSAPFPTSSTNIWKLLSEGFTYALPLVVELGEVIYIHCFANCVLYNSPNPGNQGGVLRTIFTSTGNGNSFKNLQSGKIYRCTFLGEFGSSYGHWNIEIINNI